MLAGFPAEASLFAQWRTHGALHERIRPSIKTGPHRVGRLRSEIYITVLTTRIQNGATSVQLVAFGSGAKRPGKIISFEQALRVEFDGPMCLFTTLV